MGKAKADQFLSPEGHPRDRIIINESSEVPREGVFLSLNGYPFLAKPNVPIDLPRPVRKMLDTRIRTEVGMADDGTGRLTEHVRHVRGFSYQLVKEDVDKIEVPDSAVEALRA